MSLPTISFRDLLTQFAASVDRAYDPVQGIDELANQSNAKFKFASLANTAMDRIWRPQNAAFAWKWTTTGALVSLDNTGFIPWNLIQNSDDWFNLWNQDPRPPDNPPNGNGWWVGNSAYPVPCAEDVNGFWPRISQAQVFVFWRIPRPKFSSRVVASTTYPLGSIVYDESATGHCYLALVANASGSALTDAAQWAVQAPPDRIGNVIAESVETMRLQATGADQSSKINQTDFDAWMDTEMARELPRDGSGPPWAYNRWHPSFRQYFR